MSTTVADVLARLTELGHERVRELNIRNGAGDAQFGVRLGDVRKLAKELRVGHEVALDLWATGNLEALRQLWLADDDPWTARAGWALTAGRVARSPEGLDLTALLDRLEAEMASADPAAQWTMNNCLAYVGIHHADLRARALAIGEALGLYRDYPVSKGCTSPFAPIWIGEMVRRQA